LWRARAGCPAVGTVAVAQELATSWESSRPCEREEVEKGRESLEARAPPARRGGFVRIAGGGSAGGPS
jgi:hypothetical protein